MKKYSKFLCALIGLASLTACSSYGSAMEYGDAKVRYQSIKDAKVAIADEFTIETKDEEDSYLLVVSKTSQATYEESKVTDDGVTKTKKIWTGMKDGSYYTFTDDNGEKTYTVSSTLAGVAFEASLAAMKTKGATEVGLKDAYMAVVFNHEAGDEDLKDYLFYSKGEKNLTVKEEDDDEIITMTYDNNYFKSYKKEHKNSEGKVTSKTTTTYKTSAKVSLPSTSGYTKK